VELRSVKAEELLQMARRFRERAKDCEPGHYHDLIIQSARELEELAASLTSKDGSELVIVDEDDEETPKSGGAAA